MRMLNIEEERLCFILLQNSGPNCTIATLMDDRLQDVSIKSSKKNTKIELFYNQLKDIDSDQDANELVNKMQEISILIMTTINMIKLLEKGGYIMLLQMANVTNDDSTIGQLVESENYTSMEFADKNLSKKYLHYRYKEIYITEEFKMFCNKGFISRDELRYQRQSNLTRWILIVAIVAFIVNILISICS